MTTQYDYDTAAGGPNRLTTMGSKSFSYDANGNITGDGRRVLSYDEKNQLLRVTSSADSVDQRYLYDADGLRANKTGVGPFFSDNFDDEDIHDGVPLDWDAGGSVYWGAVGGTLNRKHTAVCWCANPREKFLDFEADSNVLY